MKRLPLACRRPSRVSPVDGRIPRLCYIAPLCLVVALAGGVSLRAQETAGGYSIEEALSLAGENAVVLTIERFEMLKAAAAVREAKARSGPRISLQTSGSALTNPSDGVRIEEGAFGYIPIPQSTELIALPDQDYVFLDEGEYTYFTIAVALSQPIYTSGKLIGSIRAANLGLLVAEREYESKEREIAHQVRSAYFGAVFAGTTERILSIAEESAQSIVADLELAFAEGVVTRVDLLGAISRKMSFTSQTAAAHEAERSARSALSLLTGGDRSEDVLETDYRTDMPQLDEEDLVIHGLDKSPTRAALLHRIDQTAALAKIEKGSRLFLPDVSLNVSLDVTGQSVPFAAEDWTDSWDANLIVTVGSALTLFDSGASASRVEQAEHNLEIARRGLEALEEGFELQVRRSVEAIRSGWHEINRSAANLDLAREIERNASVSVENELISRAEFLGARLAALAAELDFERARFLYEMSLTELEAAVGDFVFDM